jgi:hypothetical protein
LAGVTDVSPLTTVALAGDRASGAVHSLFASG